MQFKLGLDLFQLGTLAYGYATGTMGSAATSQQLLGTNPQLQRMQEQLFGGSYDETFNEQLRQSIEKINALPQHEAEDPPIEEESKSVPPQISNQEPVFERRERRPLEEDPEEEPLISEEDDHPHFIAVTQESQDGDHTTFQPIPDYNVDPDGTLVFRSYTSRFNYIRDNPQTQLQNTRVQIPRQRINLQDEPEFQQFARRVRDNNQNLEREGLLAQQRQNNNRNVMRRAGRFYRQNVEEPIRDEILMRRNNEDFPSDIIASVLQPATILSVISTGFATNEVYKMLTRKESRDRTESEQNFIDGYDKAQIFTQEQYPGNRFYIYYDPKDGKFHRILEPAQD